MNELKQEHGLIMACWVEYQDGHTEKLDVKEEDEKNAVTGLIMTGSVFAVIGMFIQFGFASSLITLGASLIIMGVKR